MGMHYLALHWDQILKVVGTMTSSKIKSKSNHDGAQYELPIHSRYTTWTRSPAQPTRVKKYHTSFKGLWGKSADMFCRLLEHQLCKGGKVF